MVWGAEILYRYNKIAFQSKINFFNETKATNSDDLSMTVLQGITSELYKYTASNQYLDVYSL